MKKDNISSGVSIFTASFALTNIEQILSIIILIISILNILINMGIKIYLRIKNKQIEEIPNDIKQASEEIENLKEKEGNKNE